LELPHSEEATPRKCLFVILGHEGHQNEHGSADNESENAQPADESVEQEVLPNNFRAGVA
jgi:hypothetical protein